MAKDESRGPVLLVGAASAAWDAPVATMEREGFSVERLAAPVAPEAVAERALEEGAVVVVDLAADLEAGMTALRACRGRSGGIPVVVVAENPSVELVQRIRSTGVFFIAVHPVASDEILTVLHDAFRHVGGRRSAASACREGKRILVVDDDVDFRASVVELLRDRGYAVAVAQNGRAALDAVLKERPDLVVLDIVMEYDAAGYEVTQALRYRDEFAGVRSVPILMVSSIELDPATRFSRSEEMPMIQPDLYMTKPLDVPRFLANVDALLGTRVEEGAVHG